jgi:hypothetical protein
VARSRSAAGLALRRLSGPDRTFARQPVKSAFDPGLKYHVRACRPWPLTANGLSATAPSRGQ